jgi:hypothetical protein
VFLRILSVCYFIGGVLHALDLLNMRLSFGDMVLGWKLWTVGLMLADMAASIGLWGQKNWGIILFLVIACSQLLAYIGFRSYFGDQLFLIGFHALSLLIFALLLNFERFKARSTKKNKSHVEAS